MVLVSRPVSLGPPPKQIRSLRVGGSMVVRAPASRRSASVPAHPANMIRAARRGARKQCGCCESTDIGAYDTFPRGFVCCYANANKAVAERRWREKGAMLNGEL